MLIELQALDVSMRAAYGALEHQSRMTVRYEMSQRMRRFSIGTFLLCSVARTYAVGMIAACGGPGTDTCTLAVHVLPRQSM